jgi:hypothetical protein
MSVYHHVFSGDHLPKIVQESSKNLDSHVNRTCFSKINRSVPRARHYDKIREITLLIILHFSRGKITWRKIFPPILRRGVKFYASGVKLA